MAGPFDFLRNNNQAITQLGLGLLSGRTTNEQAAMGAQGLSSAINQNKTVEWLAKSYPELAQSVQQGLVSPGDAFKLAWSQKLEAEKPKSLDFKTLDDGTYGSWDDTTGTFSPLGKAPKPVGGDGSGEYGLNPQYGIDKDGNPVIVQLSKAGTSKQTALPDGVTLSKEPIKLDAGTHFVLLDPITRQPIGQIQKDLAGAESLKVQGEAQGGAVVALPGARSAAQRVAAQVDDLANDREYVDEGGFLHTNTTPIYLRYISDALIANVEAWPTMFWRYVAMKLAYETCDRITNGATTQERLQARLQKALRQAKSVDARNENNKVIYTGSWVRSRLSGGGLGNTQGGTLVGGEITFDEGDV